MVVKQKIVFQRNKYDSIIDGLGFSKKICVVSDYNLPQLA